MKGKDKIEGPSASVEAPAPSVCVVCGKPTSRTLDGECTCDEHAELVYEDQVESYTQQHLANNDWLEKKG